MCIYIYIYIYIYNPPRHGPAPARPPPRLLKHLSIDSLSFIDIVICLHINMLLRLYQLFTPSKLPIFLSLFKFDDVCVTCSHMIQCTVLIYTCTYIHVYIYIYIYIYVLTHICCAVLRFCHALSLLLTKFDAARPRLSVITLTITIVIITTTTTIIIIISIVVQHCIIISTIITRY